MSSKGKADGTKFGLMDRLKKSPAATDTSGAAPAIEPADEGAGDVKFTTYLDGELHTQLQLFVAKKKAQKRPGQERVSIKSVVDLALREYLERHGE
ncbi:hypothetical protein [Deinococcus sp. S9]|uniref:hypothetical protein n=1 Tax=Deinococcus sp. S9 TaxID=2545754 RepID=UPI001056B476|nr:hypothetical protein [Deinococcus sp. S9]TDE84729.1 hypothetical protein E0686_15555 [Deinococcus sp. S9]